MSDSSLNLSRRTFVKTNGALGALAAAGGGMVAADSLFGSGAVPAHAAEAEEKIAWGRCAINCPGRCSLKFHVKDDEVVWVDTYTTQDGDFEDVQPRACLRGRTYRRWLADPNRVNYPMKRVGKRGEGKFEQISWDEAVDTIAGELKRIIDTYGNESVYIPYATGVSATTARTLPRFVNCLGGYLGCYGDYSAMQMEMIVPYTIGMSAFSGSALNAADDAALILAFGTSPTETRQGGAVSHGDWARLRENTKAKTIYIDPRLNDSNMGRSSEWLPINPGTDAALCSAIAYELIKTTWWTKSSSTSTASATMRTPCPSPPRARTSPTRITSWARATITSRRPRVGRSHHRHLRRQDQGARSRGRHRQAPVRRSGMGSAASQQRRAELLVHHDAPAADRPDRSSGHQHGHARGLLLGRPSVHPRG